MFRLSEYPIDPLGCAEAMENERAGALVAFEGWVRNHNDGRPVNALTYEAFDAMAVAEGNKLLEAAKQRFAILDAHVVHRTGPTKIGDRAVWVGVTAEHRQEAFLAARWIMDEIKRQVPVWKKEDYADENCSEWVNTNEPSMSSGGDPSLNPQYSRQVNMNGFGPEGQRKLADSKVLVIGAGGLGCPALQYLAAAGVGYIKIVDGDQVDVTNLHRQILFGHPDIGKNKAEAAAHRLRELNPNISLEAIADAAYPDTMESLLKGADLVLDCTDGFESTYAIHDACWQAGIPLVQASVHQYDGWVQIIDPAGQAGCYRCQWPEAPPVGCVGTCADAGVLGVTPGALGVLQASQSIAFLIGHPDALTDSTLYMDIFSGKTRRINRASREGCPCGGKHPWPGHADQVLLPGLRVRDLSAKAVLVDLREPSERKNDPDWIQQMPSVPRKEWPELLDRFPERPLILCCAGGVRARKLLGHLGNPNGVYAWSKGIHDLPGAVEGG
jgi:adenylyltransferase/sulfurtransferase